MTKLSDQFAAIVTECHIAREGEAMPDKDIESLATLIFGDRFVGMTSGKATYFADAWIDFAFIDGSVVQFAAEDQSR